MSPRLGRFSIATFAAWSAMVLIAPSCTPRVSTGGTSRATTTTSTVAAAPHIDRLDPDTVRLAGQLVQVAIRGTGFAPGQPGANTIDFAGMTIGNVAANAAGTEILFIVPARLQLGGEAPPRPVMAGAYDVRVRTAAGQSNTVTLRIRQ